MSLHLRFSNEVQPAEPDVSDKPKRRWFQFSLRALLIGITVGSVGFGWYMYRWRRQQAEQRKAVVAVKELGGSASFSFSSGSYVSRMLEGHNAENDFTLTDKHLRDDDLKIFASAEMTKGLFLFRNDISDNGLIHLKHLENLHEMEQLILIGTKVSAAGVKELQQKMPNAKIAF